MTVSISSLTCSVLTAFRPDPHQCNKSPGSAVTVSGSNFTNSLDSKTVTAVDLYWLDEPYAAFGDGDPDAPVSERVEAMNCINLGVRLNSSSVTVTGGAFSASIPASSFPPQAKTTTDGTLRIGADPTSSATSGKFWYGANGICAVWDHFTSPTTSHKSSAGVLPVTILPSP